MIARHERGEQNKHYKTIISNERGSGHSDPNSKAGARGLFRVILVPLDALLPVLRLSVEVR